MTKQLAFLLIFFVLLCLGGCGKESASIGIIGGADGPTAIFVTSNFNGVSVCGLICILILTVLVVLMICRHRKQKE